MALAATVLLPLLLWTPTVVAGEEPELPPAVWRMRSPSAQEGWGDEGLLKVQFVDEVDDAGEATGRTVGFAVLDGNRLNAQGEPSMLEASEFDSAGAEVPLGTMWTVVQRELSFRGNYQQTEDFDAVAAPEYGAVTFADSKIGVAYAKRDNPAGHDYGVWRTADGGRTWSRVAVLVEQKTSGTKRKVQVAINDFAFTTTDGMGVVGVGRASVGARGKTWIIRSTDGGVTWTEVPVGPIEDPNVPVNVNLNAVAFVPEDPADHPNPGDAANRAHGVAVGKNGTILMTTDGGQRWALAPKFSGSEHLEDVALVRDQPPAPGQPNWAGTLGVVVGAGGTIGYSRDADPWQAVLATRDGFLPTLNGVTLADSLPDLAGGLRGYAVGQVQAAPVVLEMQPGDPSAWAPAPVDPRAAALPDGDIVNAYALRSVAAMPGTEGGALAVGARLMLERTPLSAEGAQALANDPHWRCVPGDSTGNPDADGLIGDDPQVDVCDERLERLAPPAGSDPFDGGAGVTPCPPEPDDEASDGALSCLASWQPTVGVDAGGGPVTAGIGYQAGSAVFLDEDVAGRGRRLIVVGKENGASAHVFMFDPDALAQRGVPGFGKGFKGVSAAGAQTGFVDLFHSPVPVAGAVGDGPRGSRVSEGPLAAYDDQEHRLYLGERGAQGDVVPPKISVVSLTGEFDPEVFEIPLLGDPDALNRTNVALAHLGFDGKHGMLYVVTESNVRREYTLQVGESDSPQVTLRAYRAGTGADGGDLTLAWTLPLEGACRSTYGNLGFLGVSRDGSVLSFACAALSGPHFGNPSLEPNTIVNVRLNVGAVRHPSELVPENPNHVSVLAEPIAGKVYYNGRVGMGVGARNVVAWNQQETGANLWDYGTGGWIGTLPFKDLSGMGGFGMEGTNPWRGRLYVSCGSRCVDFDSRDDRDGDGLPENDFGPALLAVDTLNVPAQVVAGVTEKLRLPLPEDHRIAYEFAVAVPPRTPGDRPRIFLANNQGPAYVLEDRTLPAGEFANPDPDAATRQDVPEDEAASTTRIGYGSAYGARVWWTGAGTATALACAQGFGDKGALDVGGFCGEPTLTYDWLTDPDRKSGQGVVPHGRYVGGVAGLPGGGARELRFGAVQRAELDNGTSGERAQAKAVGLYYDGGPADDDVGATGEDLRRRRARDPHRSADAEMDNLADDFERGQCGPPPSTTTTVPPTTTTTDPCRGKYDDFRKRHEDFDSAVAEEFDVHFDEAIDRGMRELDGERHVRGGCDDAGTDDEVEDCFSEFDSGDPRNDPRSPLDRQSVEERAGQTYASECLAPGTKDEDFHGSAVTCAPGEFGSTQASASLDPLTLVPKAAGDLESLSVGATGSRTRLIRHPELGVVVETEAWAADIELHVAGGTLRIGEVRSRAWTQAKGVKGTARSEFEVSFQDVEITGPTSKRFSCGRSSGSPLTEVGPANPPASDECDPHEVVNAIGEAFGGKVQATTSAQDNTPTVTGSPGGARAIVRRDPVDVMSDQVINRVQGLWELPALQLTIFNDGLQVNRIQVGFAAVFAESNYAIGGRRVETPAQPGEVTVELTDLSGAPLAGAGFALVADGDGDGRPDGQVGECVTDASGTCGFEGLDAGAYAVEQRMAPLGYLPQQGARSVFVSEGATETVEFVNGPDAAGVEVELVDPSGNPLADGEFALVPDPDGDGAVAPSDAVAASCVTGAAGRCSFPRVALGGWVLHQSAAPGGYQVADAVAFALPEPGQVAEIRVVNGTGVAGARVRIVTIIDGAVPASESSPASPWWAVLPKGLASLLQRGWVQALLFALTGMLFGAPAYLAQRRREFVLAKQRNHRP